MFKILRKRINFIFYRSLFEVCSLILKNMPEKGLYACSRGMGIGMYYFFFKQRRIAYAGLRWAFAGVKTSAQIARIARDCFIFMAVSAAEMVYAVGRPSFIRKNVRIRDLAPLDAALSKGNGVVLVTAHFGNFPLILARLALEGYRTSVIMRPVKDNRVEQFFEPERRKLGIEIVHSIPRKECVEQAIRSLRANRILLVPLDQNFGTGGVYVDFFGRKAATATGPIILARRVKAVILPCFILRDADNQKEIVFEGPIEAPENSGEALREAIQRITLLIESYIRRYPEEWSWIHRRWKSRPQAGKQAACTGAAA